MRNFFNKPLMKGKNKVLDGVCSGLAELIQVDVFWVRLLFLLLTLFSQLAGTMVIIYVILMFLMEEYDQKSIDLNKK